MKFKSYFSLHSNPIFFYTIHILFFHYIQILFFSLDLNLIFSCNSNLIFFITFKSYFSLPSNLIFHKIHIPIIFDISIITFYTTPLILAASGCHSEIVQLLLSQPNIEINCKDILTINIHSIQILFYYRI